MKKAWRFISIVIAIELISAIILKFTFNLDNSIFWFLHISICLVMTFLYYKFIFNPINYKND